MWKKWTKFGYRRSSIQYMGFMVYLRGHSVLSYMVVGLWHNAILLEYQSLWSSCVHRPENGIFHNAVIRTHRLSLHKEFICSFLLLDTTNVSSHDITWTVTWINGRFKPRLVVYATEQARDLFEKHVSQFKVICGIIWSELGPKAE